MHPTTFDTVPFPVEQIGGLEWASAVRGTPGAPAALRELVADHALRAATADARRRGGEPVLRVTSVHMTAAEARDGGRATAVRSRILAASLGRTVVRTVVRAGGTRLAEAIVILDRSDDAGMRVVPSPAQGLGGWRPASAAAA